MEMIEYDKRGNNQGMFKLIEDCLEGFMKYTPGCRTAKYEYNFNSAEIKIIVYMKDGVVLRFNAYPKFMSSVYLVQLAKEALLSRYWRW